MNISRTIVHKLLIKEKGIPAITLFIEDQSPGFGQTTIICSEKCSENTWTYSWVLGDSTMAEFFCDCNIDYLVGKFLKHEAHRFLLKETVIPAIRKALKEITPAGSKFEHFDCKIIR